MNHIIEKSNLITLRYTQVEDLEFEKIQVGKSYLNPFEFIWDKW